MGIVKAIVALFVVLKAAQIGFNVAQKIALATSKAQQAVSATTAAAEVTKGSFSSLGVIPVVGAALAAAAAIGGIAYLYSSMNEAKTKSAKDGIIDPKGGLMVSGEKGSISLDKDDSIIAGTDLFGGKKKPKNPTQPQGGGNTSVNVDMSQTNALLQQLISVISAGGDVMLDGQKVGTALNLTAYKTQ